VHSSNHGEGSLSITQRIQVITGSEALSRLPARERATLDARLEERLQRAGVPPGVSRSAVMALFLANHGGELRGLDAPAIAARFDRFLAASK